MPMSLPFIRKNTLGFDYFARKDRTNRPGKLYPKSKQISNWSKLVARKFGVRAHS